MTTVPEEAVKAEEWRQLKRWPRYYVSSFGAVKGPKGVLKPSLTFDGYLRICVSNDQIRKTVVVHALVLEAFVGPRPVGQVARHLNGDKKDNRLTNLQWGTPAENYQDKRRHGTDQTGERHGCHKLTQQDVIEIRKVYQTGGRHWGIKKLAKQFNVNKATIERAAKGKSWASVREGFYHD